MYCISECLECLKRLLCTNGQTNGLTKRKLTKRNLELRKLVDKHVKITGKKRLILQRGGFIHTLLAAELAILASLIAAK